MKCSLIVFTLFFLFSGLKPASAKIPGYDQLPPLEEVEVLVLKHAGLDPKRIRQWQSSVKWSAALPRVQVGWESKFLNQNTTIIQDSVSVTSSGVTVGPESNRIDADFSNNQNFEFKAVWALDELLFNQNQISISREARDLFFVRSKLIEELHENYFSLKTLLLSAKLQPRERANPLWVLKVEQKIERINSLTGGVFKKIFQNQKWSPNS